MPKPKLELPPSLAPIVERIATLTDKEFGLLARWMTQEANRRRDAVRALEDEPE